MKANREGMKVFESGGAAMDAVEAGVRVIEADKENSSVGYGGTPNSDGVVELDASVMSGADLRCGGVAALKGIMHPVSVARKVMEDTPHVLLVGDGACKFAKSKGFVEEDLLTPKTRKTWEKWKKSRNKNSAPPKGSHDTIGMIALDVNGRMAAAVTTSGLGYKLPGRVGDSPLIGCGMYVDDRAGAAVATGVGEEAIRILGSFLVVEMMRRGATPEEAVMEALERAKKAGEPLRGKFQLAFLAMTPQGETFGAGVQKGFSYAVSDGRGKNELVQGEGL